MLKDRYFYPLAGAVIAAMIWYALSAGNHKKLTIEQIAIEGFSSENEELKMLTASRGTSFNYVDKSEQERSHVILKANVDLKDAVSAGVFAALGPKYELAFANRDLNITIRARQGSKDPLSHFYMGYFTADVGDSGWIRQTLTPDWQDYKIEFKPNPPKNDTGIDYLGVWPGEKGSQKTMEIQSMRIDVLPKLRK